MASSLPETRVQPSDDVLRAFSATECPTPLPGGAGHSWRSGNLVLKPGGGMLHDWLCTALDGLTWRGVRVAAPVPAASGSWSHEGWTASTWLHGSEADWNDHSTLTAVLEAGRAFHECVAHLPRPRPLDDRSDWWALADRTAWGERTSPYPSELADVARRLAKVLEPLGPSQLVHGDLTGNVLLARDRAPAVIDVSPYWRPTAYAEGVVVADALCWHGADRDAVERAGVSRSAVARALLFRIATTAEQVAETGIRSQVPDEARRYQRAADLIDA